MSLREAAQRAMDEMIQVHGYWYERNRLGDEGTSNLYDEDMPIYSGLLNVIDILRTALAQPPEERNFCPRCGKRSFPDTIHTCTPPQAEPEGDALTAAYMLGRYDGKRKPLTDEEIEGINRDLPLLHMQAKRGSVAVVFARAIERAHGISSEA